MVGRIREPDVQFSSREGLGMAQVVRCTCWQKPTVVGITNGFRGCHQTLGNLRHTRSYIKDSGTGRVIICRARPCFDQILRIISRRVLLTPFPFNLCLP